MLSYLARRLAYMVPTLLFISLVCFLIIQLPPGDFLNSYVSQLRLSGDLVDQATIDELRARYGLDQPVYTQYLKWIGGVLQGDFGYSFEWEKPVRELVGDRLLLTMIVSICSILFSYGVAIPIGIYSATHQYSVGDYLFTFVGFLGLATPNFLLALVLMFFFYYTFGLSIGGLFSPEFANAAWSVARVFDLMKHLIIPVVVIGTAGTAQLVRVMRASLLDELRKQYVVTARAKGVVEARLIFKYPVRVALNPILSTVGWVLPQTISGATITAVVLSLPTTGSLLLKALLSQDMYVAGSFILLLASLTVIGTFISDLALAWVDPRIKLEARR
jgi:peptide/nickel transport system permease protein